MPSVIETAGFIAFCYLTYRTSYIFYFYFTPSIGSLDAYQAPDHWAVVTGGTAATGYGFAQSLATRGFNLVLLSRRQSNLDIARSKLMAKHHNIKIETISANSTTITSSEIATLVQTRLTHLPISVLINNIGGIAVHTDEWYRHLDEWTPKEIDDTISMNSRFMTHFTRELIPIISRHKSQRALILNISSAAQAGMPWLVMYSAIKGYMRSFSFALGRDMEAAARKIDVLNVVVGEVNSETNREPVSWTCPSSDDFSKCCLDRVGVAVQLSLREMTPYWAHALLSGLVLESLPEWLRTQSLIDRIGQLRTTMLSRKLMAVSAKVA